MHLYFSIFAGRSNQKLAMAEKTFHNWFIPVIIDADVDNSATYIYFFGHIFVRLASSHRVMKNHLKFRKI